MVSRRLTGGVPRCSRAGVPCAEVGLLEASGGLVPAPQSSAIFPHSSRIFPVLLPHFSAFLTAILPQFSPNLPAISQFSAIKSAAPRPHTPPPPPAAQTPASPPPAPPFPHSGSEDTRLLVWQALEGAAGLCPDPVHVLEGHSDCINALCALSAYVPHPAPRGCAVQCGPRAGAATAAGPVEPSGALRQGSGLTTQHHWTGGGEWGGGRGGHTTQPTALPLWAPTPRSPLLNDGLLQTKSSLRRL